MRILVFFDELLLNLDFVPPKPQLSTSVRNTHSLTRACAILNQVAINFGGRPLATVGT